MTESRTSGVRGNLAGLLFVLAVALAARAGFGIATGALSSDQESLRFPDEQWYWSMAQSIARGEGLVGEFEHRSGRMPLYPGFLSLFAGWEHGLAAARVAQWLMSAAAAGFVFLLARRIGGDVCGLIGGMLIALDPSLCGSASLILSEAIFVSGVALTWWLAWPLLEGRHEKWRWVATGLAAAGCVYLRESSLLMVLLLAVVIALQRRDRTGLVGSTAILALVVASLAPWAYRNHRVLGEWRWLTTRGGISIYDGVRPGATGASDLAEVKNSPEVAGLSEIEWDRYFRVRSREAILESPGRILRLAWTKFLRTWSPVPHAFESVFVKVAFAAWYTPLYLLVLYSAATSRRYPWTVLGLLIPAISLTAIHCLYVGSVRYRLGALPGLAVLGAMAVVQLAAWLRARPGEVETTR